MKVLKYLAVVALTLALAACGQDKGPAEAAITAATSAVDAVREDGTKFAGEKFTELEAALNSAKDRFAKGEYKAALEAAGGIAAKAQEVARAAAEKKAELTAAWDGFNAEVPKMLEDLKGRLDLVAAAKKLPDGLDQDRLNGMKAGYDEAAAMLERAKSAAAAGDFSKAIAAGSAIKTKVGELIATLGSEPAPAE